MTKFYLRSALFLAIVLVGSTRMKSQAPTLAASNLTFTSIGLNSLSFTWTRGNGEYCLVVVKPAANLTSFPANGNNYGASTTFGSGSNLGNSNYVVYDGTGTGVTVLGLTSATYYSVYIYEYNDDWLGFEYYLTSTYEYGPHYTLATSPTLGPAGVTVSGYDASGTTLSWTAGNGTYHLGALRQSTSYTGFPVDGNDYSSSSCFGSGSSLGTTSPYPYVVKELAGTSVTASCMNYSTDYTFFVTTYNGLNGANNYYGSAYGNFTTMAQQPTSISSFMYINDYAESAFTVNWEKPTSGGGTYSLVTIKAGTTNTDAPTDRTIYTASTTYGSGQTVSTGTYVVYNGSGNAVRISGLTPNTTYAVTVWEFNGGAGNFNNTTNYLTSSSLTGNATTVGTLPNIGSGLVLTPSTNSINASWINGTGSSRVVLAKPVRHRTAVYFDGTNDYVSIPYHASTRPTGQLSVECHVARINWSNPAAGWGAVSTLENGGYTLYFSSTYVYAYVTTSNGLVVVAADISMLSAGSHHFAFTFDGRYTKLYVDGAQRGMNDAGAYYTITYTYTNNLFIGCEASTGTTPQGNYFQGIIDEVRIWSTALSASTLRSYQKISLNTAYAYLAGLWHLDDGYTATTTCRNSSSVGTALNGVLTNSVSTAASGFLSASGWVYSGSGMDEPIDFIGYTGNSSFQSGSSVASYYVVYNGSGNSVNITNLAPGTWYNISVFEYNGTNNNYLTATYLTGDVQTTTAPVPTITGISPVNGPVGTVVTLTGTNFSATPTSNEVYFGVEKATVLSSTATTITALVPVTSNQISPVSVTVNMMTGYSRNSFIVSDACNGVIAGGDFSENVTNTTTYATSGVHTVDLDKDGKSDLLWAMDGTSDFIGYRRNTSTNNALSFAAQQTQWVGPFTNGHGPMFITTGDIDGDGKLDVLCVNSTSNEIAIFRNSSTTGNISITTRLNLPTLPNNPTSVAIGDFDNDGRPDLVVGYASGSQVSIFGNTSSPGYFMFGDRVDYSGFSSPRHVATADIDGDGKVDLSAVNNAASSFVCMRSTSTVGNITFAAAVTVATTGNGSSITWTDCDNDGKPDALIAQTTNAVRIYDNNNTSGNITSGLFTAYNLTTLSGTPSKAIFGDLDGDNRPDVIVGYSASTSFSVFEQTGNFTFAARQDVTTTGTNSMYLAANDIGCDGKADVIVGNGSTFIGLYNNNGDPLASEPTQASSGGTFTNLSQTGVTFTVSNPGNGSKRLMVIRQSSVSVVAPNDGVGFVPNPAYGSGDDLGGGNYVVLNSNMASVNITGLTSNTAYTICVYEYNDDGADCKANYLQTGVYCASFTTDNYPPTMNPIANQSAICQNAGLQTVNFSGVDDGDPAIVQTITITAVSNNQTLVPNGNISVTYTSPNTTGSLSYTPATNQYGSALIIVTVNDNANNNNLFVDTFTVTVNAPPTVSTAGPDQQICTNATTLAGNNPTSGAGTWTRISTNNPAITISNPSLYNTSVNNFTNLGDTAVFRWRIANSPCPNSDDFITVKRVNCPLNADFTANQTNFCGSTANVTFTDLSTAQSTTITQWQWTFTGGSPSSFNGQNPPSIAYTAPGTYQVSLQVTDNTLATDLEVRAGYITITAIPGTPGAISGSTTVCAGQTSVNYSVSPISNATTTTWTVPAGAIIVSGQGTSNIVVNFGTSTTSGNITVIGSNSCGNGPTGFQLITVNPLPANTGVITGPSSVCAGQTGVNFSVPPINNSTGYNWTLPTGATITAGNNTPNITVSFAANAVSGTVDVVGTNACGSGSSANGYVLTVNPLPDAAGVITGPATVCEGDTASYSITILGNTSSYNWTVPSGAVILSGNNTNAIVVHFAPGSSSGNVGVNGVNGCGNGTGAQLGITVNPLPVAATSVVGSATVCAGDNSEIYFVSSITNATGYNWVLPAGFTIINGNNTNAIVVSVSPTASSGTIMVNGTNACGSGTVSSLAVTVNPLPDTAGTITGPDTVCQGLTAVVYSVPNINYATGYNWTLPGGASIVSGNNTNAITVDFSVLAVSGYITVQGTNACGNGLSVDSFALTVNPLPDAAGTIVGDSSIQICPMQTGVVYTIPPVANATGYSWTLPSGATIVSGNNTNSITVDFQTGASPGSITVTPTNGCGTGQTSMHAIVIDTVQPAYICLATVDSLSNYNQVAWDKPVSTQIDSFRIYREISSSFVHIGSVAYADYSVYKDSVYLAPPADPNSTNYRYKIAAIDACGNESEIGGHHRTIFLQANIGVGGVINLNWVPYEGATVLQYYIYRDTTGTGALQLYDSVPGANYVYTDNFPPNTITTVRYVLGVEWGVVCNPSQRNNPNVSPLAAINNTKSNIKNLPYNPNAILEYLLLNSIALVPNPSDGWVNLQLSQSLPDLQIEVFNSVGQLIFSNKLEAGTLTMTYDFRRFAHGLYNITVRSGDATVHKKLVIQ
ncbi:MAG: VCBS repeat-containing protein [Bacteroidia bacterium]|nr:VCBS repeat-containing protein [Bacteroidia bacterium]